MDVRWWICQEFMGIYHGIYHGFSLRFDVKNRKRFWGPWLNRLNPAMNHRVMSWTQRVCAGCTRGKWGSKWQLWHLGKAWDGWNIDISIWSLVYYNYYDHWYTIILHSHYSIILTLVHYNYYDLLWSIMIYYDLLCSVMIYYVLLWSIMIYYDLLWWHWYTTYYDLLWYWHILTNILTCCWVNLGIPLWYWHILTFIDYA